MLAISNATAKLNEIEPEAYLRYVLEYIAEHPINRIQALLPWHVVAHSPSLRLASLITRRLP
jgi:hypothetical protein